MPLIAHKMRGPEFGVYQRAMRGTGENRGRPRPTVPNTVGFTAVQLPSDYARRHQKNG